METNENIYSRFLKGDNEAFEELIDIFKDRIIFFILSYVKNYDTAEDIAMDVFVQILVHPKRYKFKGSFKSYIYCVAHNKAVDYIRKNRETACEEYTFKAEEKDNFNIANMENAEILINAMGKINIDYSRVLHLTYFEELTSEETACVMGKNKKQIGNLIYRAKAALKAELLKEGFRYEDF